MLQEIKKFFYKPNTTEIYKEKLISIIVVVVLLITWGLYGKVHTNELEKERNQSPHYTIGITQKGYKNFRSSTPNVKYSFTVFGKTYNDFQDIFAHNEGKIIESNGRYYVKFFTENPKNCILLLDFPVPDSISTAPDSGWIFMPGYENKK